MHLAHQLFYRTTPGTNPSAKRRTKIIVSRLSRFFDGDYRGIIADFRADYEKEKRRQAQAGNTPREMNLDEQATKAVATVRRYKISRAQKMLRSKGLADTDDPNIGDQLKALHLKTRDHDMPEREGGWEIKIDNIERTIGELDTDTGTGPNGMPAQLLRALIGQAEGGSGARTTSQERSPITAFANH